MRAALRITAKVVGWLILVAWLALMLIGGWSDSATWLQDQGMSSGGWLYLLAGFLSVLKLVAIFAAFGLLVVGMTWLVEFVIARFRPSRHP